ncbi:MAG: RlpA-like double-psi beta-barrel-protein domain-containing protein-containing protein [Benjaminiella poitrasii]|nr:MAG: RlpA-like double-psi beta-barrel-protein domain-containing protein-containing protein [Benjaminiella poitrasii]
MKFLVCISICILLVIIQVAKADEIRGRGLATIMKFDNSTIDNSPDLLDKRGNRGTWYSGNDLKNAACYDRNGLPKYSATIHSMIGAMAMKKFENCYKCMKITNNKHKSKTVTVKIVDKCAGCKVGKAIDLTPAAFEKLADLDQGVVDISWKVVTCPKNISPKMGPKKA